MADLKVSINEGIATLTMNRPESRNALSAEMRDLLIEELHRLELDDSIRCVVLNGEGKHFLAGGDVKFFSEAAGLSAEEKKARFMLEVHAIHPIMFAMRRMGKPVIASINGAAAGAGVSIALACDLIICAEDAFFKMAYCDLGLSPDGSSTFQLPRTVGIKKAMELCLLGEKFSAAEAKEMGLVNWVVSTDKLEEETGKLAKRLAEGPSHAYAITKQLLYRSIESQFESQLQAEAEGFSDCASRKDFIEGVTAFIEKRKPNFTDL